MSKDLFSHHSVMESLDPETKRLQLGVNQVGKRRAVTLNGEERQIIDIRKYGVNRNLQRGIMIVGLP